MRERDRETFPLLLKIGVPYHLVEKCLSEMVTTCKQFMMNTFDGSMIYTTSIVHQDLVL